jgi:hypothetical protein
MPVLAGATRVCCIQLLLVAAQVGAVGIVPRSPQLLPATVLLYQEREPGTDT